MEREEPTPFEMQGDEEVEHPTEECQFEDDINVEASAPDSAENGRLASFYQSFKECLIVHIPFFRSWKVRLLVYLLGVVFFILSFSLTYCSDYETAPGAFCYAIDQIVAFCLVAPFGVVAMMIFGDDRGLCPRRGQRNGDSTGPASIANPIV